MNADCRCGHSYAAHAHYRAGTECVDCGAGVCVRYRPVPWWRRAAGAARRGVRRIQRQQLKTSRPTG